MRRKSIPLVQARRFDLETLHNEALSLAKQPDNGPTYVRHCGKVAYVMLTERIFDQAWPDSRRAWTVEEMPDEERQMLMEALEGVIDEDLEEK
ncbi:MAG: hypothetical protein AAF999_17315 [Pseudomonadota bacterium]